MKSTKKTTALVALALLVATAVGVAVAKVDLSKPQETAPAIAADQPALRSALLSNKSSHTRACLNDGVLALLDIGERDLDVLTDWALRHCGDNMTFYLSHELERSKDETARYVLRLVRRGVETIAKRP